MPCPGAESSRRTNDRRPSQRRDHEQDQPRPYSLNPEPKPGLRPPNKALLGAYRKYMTEDQSVSAGMRGMGPAAHSNSVGAPLVGALFRPNQLRPGRPPGHGVGVTGWPPVDLGCLHREGNHKGCPYHREAIPPDGGSRLSLRTFRVGKQSPVRQYIASCATEADPDQPGQSATGSRHTARQPARSSQGSPFRLSFHSRQQPVAHRLQVDRYRARTGRDHRLSLKNYPITL